MSELTTIDFHGAKLLAIVGGQAPAETTPVFVKPMVEGMGLDWSAQLRRIKRNAVLEKAMAIMATTGMATPDQVTLPLNRIHFWLATISTRRVPDPETRRRIELYQEECADVLYTHFAAKATGRRVTLRDVGGVVKAVTHKELMESEARNAEMIAGLRAEFLQVAGGHDPSRNQVVDFIPMAEHLENSGVLDKRGRGHLSSRCSALVIKFAKLQKPNRDHQIKAMKFGRQSKYVFHVDLLRDWMNEQGKTVIRAHREKTMGQSVFPFEASKKKSGDDA